MLTSNLKINTVGRRIWFPIILLFGANFLSARIIGFEQIQKYDVYNGQAFGHVGSYEWITGMVVFAIDPANKYNATICDINLAPTNKNGEIIIKSKFIALHPKDPSKGNGIALIEVSNRGGLHLLRMYNGATTGQIRPNVPADFGSEFLLKQGYTLLWIGWQWDVPVSTNLLRLELPILKNKDGSPITGLVRADWVSDQSTKSLSLGHRTMQAYPIAPTAASDINILTVRNGLDDNKFEIPKDQWSFTRWNDSIYIEDSTAISLNGGFQSGKIYELVYKAKNPVVAGLGLAVLRDLASYAKYDTSCVFPVKKCIAQGVSQTGRLLKLFLYDGFNQDESGRNVYDGMMIYMAGAGRGSFNHRFAQPSRDGHRYSAFDYPVDISPFESSAYRDSSSLPNHGLLAAHDPIKLFYINTGYEYWGRAASLIHTNEDGSKDINIPANERCFHLASVQHFTEPMPNTSARILPDYFIYKGNPNYPAPYFKALLCQMKDWLLETKPPISSLIPTIQTNTLIQPRAYKPPFIPGLDHPISPYIPTKLYFGQTWQSDKIISQEPPLKSEPWPVLIPSTDFFGNENSGIRSIEIRVPLATYTPWSLRYNLANHREMDDFRGLFIPLPKQTTNTTTRDMRPSLSSLYKDKEDYLSKIDTELAKLVSERLLLADDIPDLRNRSIKLWESIANYYK